ncbi:MAG: type IV pilus modification PilV family protein [Planctomycetota bacterium]|jgi:prepilin-type N-terminal cleavage/methylation domain-containing protein
MSRQASRESGFTLLEMMVAMGVLIVGVTSLLGALSSGLGTRRGAEQRQRAVLLADHVIHELESGAWFEPPPAAELDTGSLAQDLAIDPITVRSVPGYPGMKYRVQFEVDPEHPDLVLAKIRISWMDQGGDVGTEFLRIMSRSQPLSQRVERTIKDRQESP